MATHEVTAGQQLGFSERLVTNAAFLLAGLCGNRSGGHCVGPGSLEGEMAELGSCVKVEVAVLGFPVPNKPYGFCGRRATLRQKSLWPS